MSDLRQIVDILIELAETFLFVLVDYDFSVPAPSECLHTVSLLETISEMDFFEGNLPLRQLRDGIPFLFFTERKRIY